MESRFEFAETWGKNQCWTSWSVYTGAKSNFPGDNDVIDGSDKEDGASPKYSLSRTVTAGESSMRNFLMPGVYKIHNKCTDVTKYKCIDASNTQNRHFNTY